MNIQDYAQLVLNGNLVVDNGHGKNRIPGKVKYCSFCAISSDATRPHSHILFNDSWPWINRRIRKAAENWVWEER